MQLRASGLGWQDIELNDSELAVALAACASPTGAAGTLDTPPQVPVAARDIKFVENFSPAESKAAPRGGFGFIG